jgi:hypothetical protein
MTTREMKRTLTTREAGLIEAARAGRLVARYDGLRKSSRYYNGNMEIPAVALAPLIRHRLLWHMPTTMRHPERPVQIVVHTVKAAQQDRTHD